MLVHPQQKTVLQTTLIVRLNQVPIFSNYISSYWSEHYIDIAFVLQLSETIGYLETDFIHSGRATQHLQQRSEWTGRRATQQLQHPFCIYQTVLCFSRFPPECIELLYFGQMVSDTEPPYHFVICCILSFVCIAFHEVKSFVLDIGNHLRSSSVSDIDEYDNWQDK